MQTSFGLYLCFSTTARCRCKSTSLVSSRLWLTCVLVTANYFAARVLSSVYCDCFNGIRSDAVSKLLSLVQHLGSHSVSVRELKTLFRMLRSTDAGEKVCRVGFCRMNGFHLCIVDMFCVFLVLLTHFCVCVLAAVAVAAAAWRCAEYGARRLQFLL